MNDFDKWNELKKAIDALKQDPKKFPKEAEVWISNFGKNVGFEQDGNGMNFSRPVLVVKKFNNQMFWVVPLSTKQKDLNFYFNYIDIHNQKVSAILAQMKLMSVKRLKRKIYEIDISKFEKIRYKLKSFL